MSAEELILSETDAAGVMRLTINRPTKKNALTDAMYRRLAAELDRAQADMSVTAVVLSGAGGVFTAGNDLEDFLSVGAAATSLSEAGAALLLRSAAALDAPLIAAVEGPAVGIGVTILLHCDFAYAAPTAIFAAPFVDLGLCAEGAASLLAVERLGRRAAHRLLLLGDALSADEATACELIDGVAADPLKRAISDAKRLAGKPRAALRATKRLMREAKREGVSAAFDREFKAFAERLQSDEAKTAIAAFLASRSARKA